MKPTLRVVISVLTGLSVIVVAATVVAIASSIYTNAALALGKTYANQLGQTGAGQTEMFLRKQHDIIFTSRISIATLPKLQLTADNPNFDIRSACTILKNVFRFTNYTMQTYSIRFDDGALMTILYSQLANGTEVFRCSITNTYGIPSGGRVGNSTDIAFDARTNYEYDSYALFGGALTRDFLVAPNEAGNSYIRFVARVDDATAFWSPTIGYKRAPNAPAELLFPLVMSQFNTTGDFVGFIYASISIKYLSEVLKSLDYNSPHSHSFAINSDSFIFGTSHPNPTQKITYQDANAPYDANLCRSSSKIDSYPISGIICPVLPKDFGFAPLAALMETNANILRAPYDFALDMDVEGRSYSVHGYKMNVPGRFFFVSIFFFIDFDEIVANVNNSRNIVVGVGCGLLLAGVVASALALYFILKPLEIVAHKMNATSRLQMSTPELDEESGVASAAGRRGSSIQEIFAIEVAYSQMHNAFDAFTRYVPIDIVKRLLTHGDKFRVGVNPVHATLLYSDLLGFTSICERQNPSEVANALKVFFELSSAIIVQHEGTIIQYIGDAIVAAWGALSSCEFQQVKACLAALMMNRETSLPALHDAFDSMGERIVVRIGLNCGSVLSGTIGGANRLAFTVLGTPCDFASSLEALNKKFDTRVMIGPAMVEQVSDFFCLRALGFFDSSFNGKKRRESDSCSQSKHNLPVPAGSKDADKNGSSSQNPDPNSNGSGRNFHDSSFMAGSGVLGNMQNSTIQHRQNMNNHNNNNNTSEQNQQNNNNNVMEIQEFTGYERVYELVGCLPTEMVELSNLVESKNKRTLMFLQTRNVNGNSNNNSDTDNNNDVNNNNNNNNKSSVRRNNNNKDGVEMKYKNSNNNNNHGISNDVFENNNNNSFGSAKDEAARSTVSMSDYSSTDERTDVVSTLSSALKKKNGKSSHGRTKKKTRLTARALFETACTFSSQFIVATENEILFCNEFNAIVDAWNNVEVSLVPSKKIAAETIPVPTSPVSGNNTLNSTKHAKIYSTSPESTSANLGGPDHNNNFNNKQKESASPMSTALRSSSSTGITAFVNHDQNVEDNTNNNKDRSSSGNLAIKSPQDVIKALRNVRARYPVFFQESEVDAQRFAKEHRCVSSYMYCHRIIEKVFGRKIRREVFKNNRDEVVGSDSSDEDH